MCEIVDNTMQIAMLNTVERRIDTALCTVTWYVIA